MGYRQKAEPVGVSQKDTFFFFINVHFFLFVQKETNQRNLHEQKLTKGNDYLIHVSSIRPMK